MLLPSFEGRTHAWVTRAIRAEMVKSGITFGDLAQRINALGGDENERNLRNKVARGTFSAALFAQCLAAMGCKSLNIDLLDRLYAPIETEPKITRLFGRAAEVADAVWASFQSRPPVSGDVPTMEAIRNAVGRTDIGAWLKSEMSLEDLVRDIRKKLATD